jgi:hypothetical protein
MLVLRKNTKKAEEMTGLFWLRKRQMKAPEELYGLRLRGIVYVGEDKARRKTK